MSISYSAQILLIYVKYFFSCSRLFLIMWRGYCVNVQCGGVSTLAMEQKQLDSMTWCIKQSQEPQVWGPGRAPAPHPISFFEEVGNKLPLWLCRSSPTGELPSLTLTGQKTLSLCSVAFLSFEGQLSNNVVLHKPAEGKSPATQEQS